LKKDPFATREARKYQDPIASREHILDCLKRLGEPVGFKRLVKTLGLDQSNQREALRNRLRAMVRDGQLVVDRRNIYAIASKMELLTGKISAHQDGYGFLLQEGSEEDVFLAHRQMRQVFHGDFARVRIRGKDRRGRSEGEIVEVVERNTQQLVGRYYVENNHDLLEPLNRRINHEVMLRNKPGKNITAGQIVVAQIIEQPSLHGVVVAEIVEVLGDHLTPGIEVDIALRNNDIPVEWPDEVIEAVDRMPFEVKSGDKRNRFDLTELPFVTIDGEDARDFDDAVYCEAKENGGWRLYVAIADVSHYVSVGSDLDNAAFERGTSVYFPQYVVPMLPEKLSNGLCSLNPEVDRLVLVCEMTISARGRISSFQFYEGVIFSHARLTYTEVARVINSQDLADPTRRALKDLVPHLDELHKLYKVLVSLRKQRGAIEFDTTELQFQFGADGRVQSIDPRARNTAHRIIEECMLCANVSAARFISKHNKPGLYRVHQPPEMEKVEYLAEFLNRFGVSLKVEDTIKSADYQRAANQLRDKKNGHVLQMALLRSMNRAVYQMQNEGHFGLGYPEYTHFTSPIRRYPDLLTHRYIKSVIHSRTKSELALRVGKINKTKFYPYELEQVMTFGEQTSFTERRADSAVYEVLEWIKCDYVSDRVGDILDGVITGVTKFGFFVELNRIFVEGLVHISTLVGDYYHFDQSSQCLIGERTQLVYGMGDTVQVQISRVNVDERKIDFELIYHSPLVSRRKGKSKKPGKPKSKRKPGKPSAKGSNAENSNSRSKGSRNRKPASKNTASSDSVAKRKTPNTVSNTVSKKAGRKKRGRD